MTRLVSIGNGIYARTKLSFKTSCPQSVIEQYWAKQAKCPHAKRDPKGKCYACGKEGK